MEAARQQREAVTTLAVFGVCDEFIALGKQSAHRTQGLQYGTTLESDAGGVFLPF